VVRQLYDIKHGFRAGAFCLLMKDVVGQTGRGGHARHRRLSRDAGTLAQQRRAFPMEEEKIKVRVTDRAGPDVTVYSKRPDRIEIVLGEGIHNVKCELTRRAWACRTRAA